ncbi:MAG TPA: YihY/virulence factor BrkB family protein [Tepidiformaceae bacterium]|nr:YihY/virulence factor BrkB family protein [Tepidiformaceae bacterium]
MRSRRRLLILAQRTFGEFGRDHCSQLAAGISYYVLLSLFPLLILLAGVAGLILRDQQLQADLVDAVLENVPLTETQGREDVSDIVRRVAGARAGAVGLIGLVLMAWSASNMFAAIRRSINLVYDLEIHRPIVRQKLVDFGILVALGPFFLLSIAATGLLAFARDTAVDVPWVGQTIADQQWSWFLAGFAVSTALSFVAFTVLYSIVPAVEVHPRDVWPGALTAAVLFEVAKAAFSIYLRNFSNFDIVFGSLGAVVAFLFWVYVSANIMLLGAEIAVEYPRVMRGEFDSDAKGPPLPLRQRFLRTVRGLFVQQ